MRYSINDVTLRRERLSKRACSLVSEWVGFACVSSIGDASVEKLLDDARWFIFIHSVPMQHSQPSASVIEKLFI